MAEFQEIEVNGEIIEFPADMSDEQIAAVLRGSAQPSIPAPQAAPTLPSRMRGFTAADDASGRSLPFGDFFKAALGAGEGVLDLFGKGLGGLAGGIAAAPVAFDPRANEILERVSSGVSSPFEARTPEGKLAAGAFQFPFHTLERGADIAGEATPGGPGPQTAVKTALLGLPALFNPARNVGTSGAILPRKPLTNQQSVLIEAQRAGYVAPTSSANPSSVTRGSVEGIAGKPRMQQEASFRNQQVTNNLAAQELGLPEGTVITRDLLDGVRRDAGNAYSVLENAGTIVPTAAFRRDLSNAVSNLKKVSADFPALAKADSPLANVLEIANGLNKPTFQASSVITATRVLRDEASAAFRNGQAKVGNAYRDLSKALEDAAENHLSNFGDPAAVQAFRDARVQIAKSYSIEKALDGDGFVSATKLAAQRSKREPLSGNLDLAARFAEQFPKSARIMKEAPIQTGRLSAQLGVIGASGLAGAGLPIPAALAALVSLGGPALRAGLLSRFGQATVGRPLGAATGGSAIGGGLLTSGLLADQTPVGP